MLKESDEIYKDTITDSDGTALAISGFSDIKVELYDSNNTLIHKWAKETADGYSDLYIPDEASNIIYMYLSGSLTSAVADGSMKWVIYKSRANTEFSDSSQDDINRVYFDNIETK